MLMLHTLEQPCKSTHQYKVIGEVRSKIKKKKKK